MFINTSEKKAHRKMYSIPCKPVRNCMKASVIMTMKENWTNSITKYKMAKKQEKTFVPKKSVALSGVAAGNTALASVGRSGNDLHYRGYDILDLAEACEFEEVAHLLVHGKLPNQAELTAYRQKLHALRGLPLQLQAVLESLPASSHPMDVMRTAV